MPALHFRHGGSSAARTIACPSWRTLADTLPKHDGGGGSSFALAGTLAHNVMERILEGEDALLGWTDPETGLVFDEDTKQLTDLALTAWDALCRRYNLKDYVTEQTMQLTDEIGGTADVIGWNDGVCAVVDWKFGQGVSVDPQGNAQGLFYAMLAEENSNFDPEEQTLVIAIIQPMPSRHDMDTLKIWEVPADVYALFKQTYMKAVSQGVGYMTGGHCQFCPAQAICPEKTGLSLKAKQADPAQLLGLTASLNMVAELKAWIKAVEKMAHEQLELGTQLEGWKLVAKRGTRKWQDEVQLLEKLKKNRKYPVASYMEPQKLKSPAQLEKTVDGKLLAPYIITTSSGTTLAPESDKRPEAVSAAGLKEALKRI